MYHTDTSSSSTLVLYYFKRTSNETPTRLLRPQGHWCLTSARSYDGVYAVWKVMKNYILGNKAFHIEGCLKNTWDGSKEVKQILTTFTFCGRKNRGKKGKITTRHLAFPDVEHPRLYQDNFSPWNRFWKWFVHAARCAKADWDPRWTLRRQIE